MPSRLAALLLHQRTASLDARERLTAVAGAATPGRDLVRLLTCHRVELYAVVDAGADPRAEIASRLGSDDDVLAEARVLVDGKAAAHLFHVAAGLDSAIVGEGQIAGQVRAAYETARAGGLDPILAGLFQRALHLARTVRTTTELGLVRRSIGSLAVDEALRHVPDATRATALVVGAGEIGKLAARALASRVGRLVIANRDAARAADLAGPIDADAVGLDRIADGLERADVVISAADTRGSLLTRELLAERAACRPLVLVDIAVPRSIAEDARDLPGLLYRDVDHLAAGEASAVPAAAVAAATERCAAETASFTSWLRERESADTIRALRERANEIRARQLERAMKHLGHLSERDREVVASLASGLTHALLHEPTVRMRGRPEAERAARRLFGLESDDTAGVRS
ncbi:MAG: glutamyl-tRNA reductase [Chloroflexota bacterium]|nr:glutamyl-tRNA reductase [Chloroflexota bacterium]MDE3192562.1 glutamyl-tRNA reductase [Chloroflexota bacterium]